MSEHRYTDDEVHAIFEQAAARQDEAQRAEAASRAGLTLSELQEIGAASGIDPAHIAAAALAARKPSGVRSAKASTTLGVPNEVRVERYLPHAVTDEAWERIVPELRRLFNNDGVGSEIGRVREWSARPSQSNYDRPPKVTLTPDGEGTRVTMDRTLKSSTWGFLAGGGTNLAMGFALLLIAAFGSIPILPGAIITTFGALFLVFGWMGMKVYANGQEEKFKAALDRIDLIARDMAPDGQPHPDRASLGIAHEAPSVTPNAAPRIDLDALPDAPDSERRSDSPNRTRA